MNKLIGERIKAARKAKGLSQEQLGEKLGVSFQAVSTWEQGKFIPDSDHLPALSRVLGLSLDSLFAEEEKQWDFYNKWLSSSLAKKLVIVELGEDFSNPNVIRWPFERIVMINQKAKMYRVHSTFYQIPKEIGDRACAFEMNGAQFIKELVKCC